MSKKTSIKIADISTDLILDDDFSPQVETAYQRFISDAPAQYSLRVNVVDNLPRNQIDPEVSLQDNRLKIISEEFNGYMELGKREGTVDVRSQWALNALANFLRNLYSVLIFSDGGIMLHAAAVEKDGKAYIFFGPSQSGKSTVARISAGYSVLTDELVAIRRVNGSFKAYGTPYWGKHLKVAKGLSAPVKIGGLFKLIKDKKVFLKKFSPSQAITEVLTVPKLYEEFLSMHKLLNSCADLAKVAPCYELHFLPDASFWKCIENVK